MSAKIYRFESKAERLKRAQTLATDVELLMAEGERAVPYLLTGLRDGDPDLQMACVIAFTLLHKEAALEPFYQLMADPAQDADLRDQLAISLAVIGRSRGFPEWLMERLIADLESPDLTLRGLAAIALGWEGNIEAIVPLLPRLFDSDPQVRSQAAVALSEIKDPRMLELLLDRLEHSAGEERIGLTRIRQLAAKELGRRRVASAEESLRAMLEEADMETRRVALIALQQIRGERPVSEWD
jgi:HEAT repeat protein